MKLLSAVREIKGIWWLVIAVEAGLAVIVFCELGAYSFDDAYIYLSGARQLSRGELPNPSAGDGQPPTNSFASHLWLLLLMPAFWLGVSPILWAKALGAALLIASVFQAAAALRRLRPSLSRGASFALAGVLFVFISSAFGSVNGLETALNLFTSLLLLQFVLRDFLEDRLTVALGLVAGLHLVSRPDAFIDLILVGAAILWRWASRRSRIGWRDVMRVKLGALPGLLFFAAVALIYGRLLPTSAWVKLPDPALLFSPWAIKEGFLRVLGDFFRTPGLVLAFAGFIFFISRRQETSDDGSPKLSLPLRLLLIGLALDHLAVFFLTGDPIGTGRLWLPSAATLIVLALAALPELFPHRRGLAVAVPAFGFTSGPVFWAGGHMSSFTTTIPARRPSGSESSSPKRSGRIPGWLP